MLRPNQILIEKIDYTMHPFYKGDCVHVFVRKNQTIKDTVNPPRGDGVWALCSPLDLFINELYNMMKT